MFRIIATVLALGFVSLLGTGCARRAAPPAMPVAPASDVDSGRAAGLVSVPDATSTDGAHGNPKITEESTGNTESPGNLAADKAALESALNDARRTGWALAQNLIAGVEERSDLESFAGIQAFLRDWRDVAEQIDPSNPPAEWSIDVEKLVSRNPNFWRATYEIAPSDPGWLLAHAGLLLAAGEAKRSLLLLQAGKWTPGIPKLLLDGLFGLQNSANDALVKSGALVEQGVTKYDAGDLEGARSVYEQILQLWPQCSWAHYEMGLVALSQHAGPESIKYSGPHFAQTRLHDPLEWKAYQGDDPVIIEQFMALLERREAMEKVKSTLGSGSSDEMPDSVLLEFADACQTADQHELALVTRQVIVARRGRFDPSDHPFLSKSLRALAPGPAIEAVIERLAGAELRMAQLVPREPAPQQSDASGFDVQTILFYLPTNVVSERLGGQVKPISNFINQSRTAAQDLWKELPKDDGRKMMVILYFKPNRKAKFWTTIRGKELADETIAELHKRLSELALPEVTGGPVVMGMLVDLWGGTPIDPSPKPPGLPDELLFPKEWINALKDHNEELQIPISDDVLRIIWPD